MLETEPLVLSQQPVLVVEIPRELVDSSTIDKLAYFKQPSSDLQLSEKVSPSRWRFIGKFQIIHTALEQVSP